MVARSAFVKSVLGDTSFAWMNDNYHAIYFSGEIGTMGGYQGVWFWRLADKGERQRRKNFKVLPGSQTKLMHNSDHARVVLDVWENHVLQSYLELNVHFFYL
jgi:hypothetical protein